MKVTCERRDLHEGLQTVARAVSSRSSLPILGNVLLDPGTDSLRLAATDLELGIERLVPARVGETGAFAGIIAGTAIVFVVWLRGGVSWQWYTLIGSLSTLAVGATAGVIANRRDWTRSGH